MPRFYFLLFTLGFLLSGLNAQAQYPDDQNLFGKNRLQYRQFEWSYMLTDHFEVYYFSPHKRLATQAGRIAEANFSTLTGSIGFSPYARLKIFVYPNNQALLQSNRGVGAQDFQAGGQTNFTGNVVELAYTGREETFEIALKEEIVRAYLFEMMYGGNFKDILQSTYLLSLPDWFLDGASGYIAAGWNDEMADYVRSRLYGAGFPEPERLRGEEAKLVGMSVWNYIRNEYGKPAVSNILNLTRIVRSERTAIRNTLGISYEEFLSRWQRYYRSQLVKIQESHIHFPKDSVAWGNPKKQHILELIASPKGKQLAWVQNQKGHSLLRIKNLETQKTETLFKAGYRVFNQQHIKSLPLLFWKTESEIVMLYTKNNTFFLQELNIETKKSTSVNELAGFTHIVHLAQGRSEGEVLLVGRKLGDRFLRAYAGGGSRFSALTPDEYDVTEAIAAPDKSVYFTSSQFTSEAQSRLGNALNLFRLSGGKSEVITSQIADIQGISFFNDTTILFTSNLTGVRQLYAHNTNTRTHMQVSNWINDIQDYAWCADRLAVVARQAGTLQVLLFSGWQPTKNRFTPKTPRREIADLIRLRGKKKMTVRPVIKKDRIDTLEKVQPDMKDSIPESSSYDFDNFEVKKRKRLLKNFDYYAQQNADTLSGVRFSGARNYESRFSFERSIISFAFDPIRDFGLLFEVGMTDALEHHKFSAGLFNLGLFNIQNGVLFAEYQYLRNRLDYSLRLDRRSYTFFPNFYLQKYTFNRLQGSVSYPLNVTTRFVASPSVLLTTFGVTSDIDPAIQSFASENVLYSGLELSAIHDHSVILGPNIRSGARVNASLEFNYSPTNNREHFGRFVLDARYYKPITRGLHFAGRISYGHSFGGAPKIFRLGGVDNWINRDDIETNADPYFLDENDPESYKNNLSDFLFLRYATPLRGFSYNKLYGSNFMLMNAEVRVPLLDFLHASSVRSRFVQNFQFVAFTDVGSAWTGISPFNRQNALNTVEIGGNPGNPFYAKVSNFKDPFLVGYGFGLRSRILSYFAKLDIAWGLEDGTQGPVTYHLSIGYDF